MSELLDQCIRQLRDRAWARTVWPEQPAALATRLEWRRDNPASGDGFDLNLTSDETRDRTQAVKP